MRSIRSRLSALTSVAIIISILAMGIVSVQFIRNTSNRYSDEMLRLTCERNEQRVDSYFENIEQCVATVAYYATENVDQVGRDEMSEYLKNVDALFHSVVNTTKGVITYYFRTDPEFVSDEPGFWYSRHGRSSFVAAEPTDITKFDPDDTEHVGWFYEPKKQGRAMWLDPYVNENLDNVRMISYVTPIYKGDEFVGVLGIDYDYDTLCRTVEYSGSFKTGYAFLCDDRDRIIYHPELESGTPVSEISEALAEKNLSSSDPMTSFSYNGVQQRCSWRLLTNGMRLCYAVDEAEIRSSWHGIAGYFAMIAIAMLVAFTVVSLFVAGRITKPLTDLTETAVKIDSGDYDAKFDYEGDDEIGVLAGAFRQLTDHLAVYINDLNDKAYKDALTSVRNKAAFDMYATKLDDRIRTSEDGSKPEFAIVMFDCNGLKTVNDTYGHDKGDIYLRRACSLICDTFRHSPVFRLGGDEFVCILQNEDYDNRVEICREFERSCVEVSEKAEEPWEEVNIARGISKFKTGRDESIESVLKRADMRMYEDKQRKKSGLKNLLLEDELKQDNE